MKNTISIIFSMILGLAMLQAQNFVKVNGTATDIAISPRDGKVFVISGKNMFHEYNFKTKKWKLFGSRTNSMKSVSIDKQGKVYMVSTQGDAYKWQGSWKKMPGASTDELICSQDGRHLFAINKYNYKIRRYNPNAVKGKSSNWPLVNDARINSINGLKQVISKGYNEYYARNLNNEFVMYKGNRWNTLNGKPNQIALDHKTGIIYAVGRNKGIYKWVDNTRKWELLPGTRKDFKTVAVHQGKIWATTTANAIYYYNKPEGNSTTDYTGTYKVSFNKLGSHKNFKYYGTMGVYLEAQTRSGNVSIKPTGNKPNRFWDISKTRPYPTNGPSFIVDVVYNDNRQKNWTQEGSFDIDKERTFRIAGEAAKGNPTFDFQFNIKREAIGAGRGKWQRIKIPLKQITLGKEYFYFHHSSVSVVSFKIEKL